MILGDEAIEKDDNSVKTVLVVVSHQPCGVLGVVLGSGGRTQQR